MTSPSALIRRAELLRGLGANILPVDGKRPIGTWSQWQSAPQSLGDVRAMPWRRATRIGIINGPGGYRSLDWDHLSDEAPALALLADLGLPPNYPWVERSTSGDGLHAWVRCVDDLPTGALAPRRMARGGAAPGVYWARCPSGAFDHIELRWSGNQTVVAASAEGAEDRWLHGPPAEPPALITPAALIDAWRRHTIPMPVVSPVRSDRQPPRRPPPVAVASEDDRSPIALVKKQFDLLAFCRRYFDGEEIEERGEVRITGHGGLLVDPDAGVWYCHGRQIGGDAIDLVGWRRHRAGWDRTDPAMFKAALREAAAFAGVALPPLPSNAARVLTLAQLAQRATPIVPATRPPTV